MQLLALRLKALSDTTRLRIILLLGDAERCVCDLVAVLNMPQPKISRHLAYLKRTGWVKNRRAGKWLHYSLAENVDANRALRDALDRTEQAAADRAAMRDYLKEKKIRCGG